MRVFVLARQLLFTAALSATAVALVWAADDDGFQPIFNGKDLTGWEGDPKLWSVQDGAITGVTTDKEPLAYNKFLIWRAGSVKNFELRTKFRMVGDSNSGIQYRSKQLPDAGEFVVAGYQADIHPAPNYTGMLYDERGRGILVENCQKVVVDPQGRKFVVGKTGTVEPVKLADWNELVVIARGNHLIHKINGKTVVDILDHQADQRELEGILALQVHRGPAMTAQFKEMVLKRLPDGDIVPFDKASLPADANAAPEPAPARKKAQAKAQVQAKAKARIALNKAEGTAASGSAPEWIWIAGETGENQTVGFRKSFTLASPITSARLHGTCDNGMSVFIDGKPAIESTEWETPVSKDVTSLFTGGRPRGGAGKHVLAVRGRNEGGPAGLVLKLVVEHVDKSVETVITNAAWKVAPARGRDRAWTAADFDDSSWQAAKVVAKLGEGPWARINAARLDAATPPKETQATPLSQMKVLKDFKAELLYSVPNEQGSWVNLAIDPRGRLITSDQYGKLFRITPPALGADPAGTKVEPIDVEIGEAQGLLWAFDSLYVVVNSGGKFPSGLYRVKDTNNDDKLDTVETLRKLDGGGEHGPHAVLLSPDKKSLYIVCGNGTRMTQIDESRVPRVWGEDHLLPRMPDGRGFMAGVLGPGGCIYKIDPDGKSWELISTGYRNEFDAGLHRNGDFFTYDADMEWDFNTPWYRPTRVCLVASGSDYGWRNGAGKRPPYYVDTLPAIHDVGPGSPTGVTFGYGAKFPAKYQDAFFICDWSYGKLYAVHLKPQGSSYTAEAEEFITGTPLPLTDAVINPKDGAMYFAIGGRRAKSGLYRVTYIGGESTAPIAMTPDAEGAADRATRVKLESFHGKRDPQALDLAWPLLKSPDRFIRHAARVAVEFQDPSTWRDRALSETEPETSIQALLALARVSAQDPSHRKPGDPAPDESLREKILDAIAKHDWKALSETQRVEIARVIEIVLTRFGQPDDAGVARLIARLDPLYPGSSREFNVEMTQVLAFLQAPNTASKGVKLLSQAPTQEEQMDYARYLRFLKAGWTPELRKQYFEWFLKAATYSGGASFGGFVANIKRDAISTLGEEDKIALKSIIDAPISAPARAATVNPLNRPVVKEWTVDELLPIVETKLKNRDFDRGRNLFAEASCFSCHRYSNEGGAAGPDLTGVSGRYGPRDLLESMIHPSKVISDQYQAVTIALDDGQVITGRIVNLSGDGMMINTNMLDPNAMVNVDRRHIEELKPSPLSMMPDGLLNIFKEDEVLDLVAYLLSRGDRGNPMFKSTAVSRVGAE